jgi:hypothetical protein
MSWASILIPVVPRFALSIAIAVFENYSEKEVVQNIVL